MQQQHQNEPGVFIDPVIRLLREPHGRVRAEAIPYLGARPETWVGRSESIAIHWAGNSLREINPSGALCVEWGSDSVGHSNYRMTPMCELSLFWLARRETCDPVAHARCNLEDRTALDLDSVDGWAPVHLWPSGVVGPQGKLELP